MMLWVNPLSTKSINTSSLPPSFTLVGKRKKEHVLYTLLLQAYVVHISKIHQEMAIMI